MEMRLILLAQADINWIEVIILLVIFGGGAISALLKWLVNKFTPQEAGKTQPGVPAPTPTGRAAPKAQPPRPLARPASPTRHAAGQPAPPHARPQTARPARPASVRPAAPAKPVWAEPRRVVPPRPVPRREHITVAAAPIAEEQHEYRHLRSKLREHDADTGEAEAEVIAESIETDGLPTHAELRRAIVLRELLGPPIALRPQRDAHEI